MAGRRRNWRRIRSRSNDEGAETPDTAPGTKPSADASLDQFETDQQVAKLAAENGGAVDEASTAELQAGLGDVTGKLDQAGAVLGDASADGASGLTGTSGTLDSGLRTGKTFGDAPDLETGLPSSSTPTSGSDLTANVGIDDPVLGGDAGPDPAGSTSVGGGDPTGSGMGEIGSSSPSDLRQTDQSTMTNVGGGDAGTDYDILGPVKDWITGDVVKGDVGPQAEGSDATHPLTDGLANQKAYVEDAAGQAADENAVVLETQAWSDAIQAERGVDPQPDSKPEPESAPEPEPAPAPEPEPEPEPEPAPAPAPAPAPEPAPEDGTQTQSDPDAAPVDHTLPGREPGIGDLINLDPELGIESPDLLQRSIVDEDEWTMPTEEFDQPIADVRDFGEVDPGTQIMEGDGDGDMELP